MTTPCSPNQIAFSDINVELGRAFNTANSNINEGVVRTLAGIPSGQIDFNSLRCKTNS